MLQSKRAMSIPERLVEGTYDHLAKHVVLRDAEHRVPTLNEAAAGSAGLPKEDLIGRAAFDLRSVRSEPRPDRPACEARGSVDAYIELSESREFAFSQAIRGLLAQRLRGGFDPLKLAEKLLPPAAERLELVRRLGSPVAATRGTRADPHRHSAAVGEAARVRGMPNPVPLKLRRDQGGTSEYAEVLRDGRRGSFLCDGRY